MTRKSINKDELQKVIATKGYCLGTSIGGNRYPHIWDSIFLLYLILEYLTDQLEGKAVHSNKLVDISQSRSSCTSLTEKGFSQNLHHGKVNKNESRQHRSTETAKHKRLPLQPFPCQSKCTAHGSNHTTSLPPTQPIHSAPQ